MNQREINRQNRIKAIIEFVNGREMDYEYLLAWAMDKFMISRRTAREYIQQLTLLGKIPNTK